LKELPFPHSILRLPEILFQESPLSHPMKRRIHIPKCAGNSVLSAIKEALQPRQVHVMDAIATYFAARKLKHCQNEFEFESIHLEVKQVILSLFFEKGFDLISGHYPFSPLTSAQFKETTDFITVLRDPLERLKSHIAYLIFAQPRTCVEDYYTGKVDPAAEVDRIIHHDSIGEWLPRQQTIYLGGLGSDGKADLANRVPNAIAALDQLRVVGFDHDLPQLAQRLEDAYGVPFQIGSENSIRDVQKNDALRKRVYDAFEGSMKNTLIQMSADDLEFYEAARAQWD